MEGDLDLQLLEELRGFMQSRVVLTAADLGIFDFIYQKGTAKVSDIVNSLELDLRATTRLLDCLVSLGFLAKNADGYELKPKGLLLTSYHPKTILPMVKHYSHLWKNWSNLTETIKLGKNPKRETLDANSDTLKSFIYAMHVIGRSLAKEIVEFYDASSFKRLLDIGCGSGTYSINFLLRYPDMEAVLFDTPSVIPLAKERLEREGLLKRATLVAGDFYKDELPQGCDLALLSAIIHQNSPEENIELYRKVYRALVPGGKLLIRDHIMSEDRTWPPAGALFAINMLVMTEGGDTYTFSEVSSHLEEAGFTNIKLIRSGPKMDCLVEATKPS